MGLDAPLKISKLQQRVRECFPNIKDFGLHYTDEEGDNITVSSDEDLSEAQSVFNHLGRVISFVVDTSTTPDCPTQPTTTTADASKSPKCNTNHQKANAANSPAKKPASCAAEQKIASNFLEHPERLAEVVR